MEMSRSELNRYAATVDKMASNARKSLEIQLQTILASYYPGMPKNEWKALRKELMDALEDVRLYWGDAAMAAAAEFYDGFVGARGRLPPATIVRGDIRGSCENCIRSLAKILLGGDAEKFIRKVCDNAEYNVKLDANNTITRNAKRDQSKGVKYARVPTSREPCAFCVLLAGRGFVYASEKVAVIDKEGEHYHVNCKCKAVPGFDGDTVEGYDPKVYLAVYERAWNKTVEEEEVPYHDRDAFNETVIKNMRRELMGWKSPFEREMEKREKENPSKQ